MTTDIRPLGDTDPQAVEALLDEAFGSDRRGRTAYRLRAGTRPLPALSFAGYDGGELVASLQSWPVQLLDDTGQAHPLVLVGPIAVRPSLQRAGHGRRITAHALAAADAAGERALVLIGDPEYYERWFGFSAAATGGWRVPGPVERRRLLARLAPGTTLPVAGELGPRLCATAPGILDRTHA